MAERKAISKSIRFEVFKRDKFTCQYCGRSAPDVILQIDHIQPVADDGDNDILNLVTSCFDCNSGKSSRPLSDDAVIRQRKAQLDDLQDRREQLEMLIEWQRSLTDLQGCAAEGLAELWHSLTVTQSLTDHGMQTVRRWLVKFGYAEIAEAMRVSVGEYTEIGKDCKPTQVSINKAFDYIPKICTVRRGELEKPYLKEMFYTRGILRKRCGKVDHDCLPRIEAAIKAGVDIYEIQQLAKAAEKYWHFTDDLEKLVKQAQKVNHG